MSRKCQENVCNCPLFTRCKIHIVVQQGKCQENVCKCPLFFLWHILGVCISYQAQNLHLGLLSKNKVSEKVKENNKKVSFSRVETLLSRILKS